MNDDHPMQPRGALRPEVADAAAVTETYESRRRNLRRGSLMIVAAMLLIPCIDAIAKYMSDEISPGQLSWARFVFQATFLIGIVAVRKEFYLGRNVWKHIGRGVLISTATLLFFGSLSVMPLADTIAIFFVEPLILTLLAPVFLKEQIGWRRVVAVICGFGGSLFIIQPSFENFGWVAFLPMGAALAMAIYIILTRSLTRDTGTFAMQFYAGIFGGLFMTAALLIGTLNDVDAISFTMPAGEQWLWMMALAAIATIGHLLIVQAVRHIGASMIAPFQYLEIVTAVSLGYLVFGDFPGPAVWVGIVIIVLSGLYVFHREQVQLRNASD